jgi:predicted AlkP superfamily phosphohydrolase/phosphomutase
LDQLDQIEPNHGAPEEADPASANKTPRVLVIGLDGATFDLIDPWVREGKLPVLARCLREGVRAGLRSTPLSNSAQAWSSFITGTNPGMHGIYDFFEPIPGSYGVRFVNGSFRKHRTLWRLVSDAGKRVGVINVPMTYPAEIVNGPLIAGLDAPGLDKHAMSPPELRQEVRQKVGEYVIEPGVWGFMRNHQPELALRKLLEAVDIQAATSRYLMTAYPWDFFMVVFTATDKIQHHFWKYLEPRDGASAADEANGQAILRVYERLDRAIGDLVETAGANTTVLIISDHGAGPSSHRTMFINRWLQHEGFLTTRDAAAGGVPWKHWMHGALAKSDAYLKRSLSRRTKERLVRLLPDLRNRVDSLLSLSGIEWSRTLAYSRENHPAISINLKGREPGGIVAPGPEYEQVRQTLAERLLRLRCPETGEPIVEGVVFREEVYHGPEAYRAPDLLFHWNKHAYVHRPSPRGRGNGFLKALSPAELEEAELRDRPSGIHRDVGIFIGVGPRLKRGSTLPPADLVDVTPTILYLLGLPVPDYMDGRVMTHAVDDALLAGRPVRRSQASGEPVEEGPDVFGADEEQIIRQRLEGLGYID